MKLKKTPTSKRKTYSYSETVLIDKKKNEQITLPPVQLKAGQKYINEVGEEEILSAEWIEKLHSLDDNEVYNNNKNINPNFRHDKEARAEWNKKHENEAFPPKMPKSWVKSFDYVSPDGTPSPLLAELFVMGVDYESPEQKLVNDILEKYFNDSRNYKILLAVKNHTKLSEVANSEKISSARISKDKGNLFKEIQKKFK